MANDEITFEDQIFLQAWQSIKQEFAKLAPIYSYVDTLIQRNNALNQSLKTLHKSRLWKMIYPLRVIDNALRTHRKRLKKKPWIMQ